MLFLNLKCVVLLRFHDFLITMKRFNILTAILMAVVFNNFVSGQQHYSESEYEVFGADFQKEQEAVNNDEIYQNLKQKDTISTQLVGKIAEVCQAKGCWMRVNLANNKEVFVKFKDYGFFVPLDASGREVVMHGKAFVEEVSVEEQRHYAEDKGATKAEISEITTPKKTLRFEADGVLIKN